jgi:hypothetical protein
MELTDQIIKEPIAEVLAEKEAAALADGERRSNASYGRNHDARRP